MSIFLIRVMHFKNLQVTDIKKLYLSILTRKARSKSRVNIKKRTRGNSIGCKEL